MADAIVAGGIDSMTRTPMLFETSPFPFGGVQQFMPPSHPDTPDAPNTNMLITVGENTARECGITREESDDWSYHSNIRAVAATDDGRFAEEIVPVTVPAGRGETVTVSRGRTPEAGHDAGEAGGVALADRSRRPDHRRELVGHCGRGRRPRGGVTLLRLCARDDPAGDGACMELVRIEPARTGLAPTVCVPRALNRAGLSESDVDLVEINEAFATMAVASSRKLGFPHDIVNVNGGAVGSGHPARASGARILVTLIHELRRRGGGIGVGTLCAGGGMGSATVLEVHAPA